MPSEAVDTTMLNVDNIFLNKQDNVCTNTESVQCHHVFDIAYTWRPLYEVM